MSKYYEINNQKKVVYAEIGKIGDRDLKKLNKYITLGYELIEKKFEFESNYKKDAVIKFLNQKGNEEYLKEFNKKCDEFVVDKDTKKIKIVESTGKPKKKGYIAGLQYFRKNFEWNKENNTFEIIKK